MKRILLFLLLIIGLIGCGEDGKTGASKSKKVETSFNINLGEEGKTIDPQLATSSPSVNLLGFIEEGLTTVDENLDIIPGLAESWEVSENGFVYTFKLRKDLKWSDGSPLTAKDFKYAWLRALNPETASEYAYLLFVIENAEEYNAGKISADKVGVKVVDDRTLEVRLHTPISYFPSLVNFPTYYPLSQSYYEKHKDDYALEPDTMLYCGPYKLVNWVRNSEMTLVKNPDYYNAAEVNIDKINIKFISDSASALNAFENNELDIVGLTAEQYEKYKDDPRLGKQVKNVVWYLQYNTKIKALSNRKIREAILLAIDKETLVNTVFKGISTPAYSFTPANVGMRGINGDFVVEMGAKIPKYNVELARKLLKEGLDELGLQQLPELSLLANLSGSNKKMAEVIQEDLRKNLGITVNIEGREFKERLAKMSSGDFDMVLAGWGADYQDPMTYLDLFVTNGGNNHGKYSNPEYDRLVELAKKEVDPVKRVKYMQQLEEIIATDYPVAPLDNGTSIYLLNPKVKGIAFNSLGAAYVMKKARIEEPEKK